MDRDDVDEIKRALPPIDQLVGMTDVERKTKSEIQGEHPVHGSEGGKNLNLHLDDNTWHCFRHEVHGDKLSWIAVEEGLVDCKDADDISHVFTEVLEVACDRAGIEFDLDPKEKSEIREKKEEWNTIQKGYETAVKFFQDNLTGDKLEWIKEKYGFDREMIEEYDIGFAPPDDNRLASILEDKLGKDAYKTGLLVKTSDGFKDFFSGRVIFPYRHSGEYTYFIARRTPWTPDEDYEKAKYKKLLTPENHDYVSDLIKNDLYGLDSIKGESEVIITEGITDAISVLEMGFPCISPVTTQFKKDDIKKVKKWIRRKDVYVCNDRDEGGMQGAIKTVEMIENSYMMVLPEKYEGYDLNDYYVEEGEEAFERLKEEAFPRHEALARYLDDERYCFYASLIENTQPPEKVRADYNYSDQRYEYKGLFEILENVEDFAECVSIFRRSKSSFWRAPTALEEITRRRVISGAIVRHLERDGKFIFSLEDSEVFFFNENTHRVFKVNDDEFQSYLYQRYQLSTETPEGEFVLKEIEDYGRSFGKRIDVKSYWHYDTDEKVLYIYDRSDHYYKLDGETIEREPNGEDLYFERLEKYSGRPDKSGEGPLEEKKKIKYIEPEERETQDQLPGQIEDWEGEGNFFQEALANRTNFEGETALTKRQQRLQHLINLYIFPFDNKFSTRPIMAFVGEKGSGKTLTMRMIGKFLLGLDYEVTPLPENKRDFTVAAHNSPLFMLDNVDKSKSWVNDLLAIIATGGKIQERKLYTNLEIERAKINCWLGLNARDPIFKRDDVVDRLLIFFVARLDKNIDPSVLAGHIKEYHDTLWSIYMDDLNEIIKVWKDIDESEIQSSHRIVEWVIFARIVTRALDLNKDEVDEMINNMTMEKAMFTMSDDPLLPALRDFIKEEKVEGWYTASELDEELREKNAEYNDSYKSAMSLGKRLPHVQTELENILDMKTRKNKYKNVNEYSFSGGTEQVDVLESVDGSEEEESEEEKPIKEAIIEMIKEGEDEFALIDDLYAIEGYDKEEINNELERLESDGIIYTSGPGVYELT